MRTVFAVFILAYIYRTPTSQYRLVADQSVIKSSIHERYMNGVSMLTTIEKYGRVIKMCLSYSLFFILFYFFIENKQ